MAVYQFICITCLGLVTVLLVGVYLEYFFENKTGLYVKEFSALDDLLTRRLTVSQREESTTYDGLYNDLLLCQEKRLKNLRYQCMKHGLYSNLSKMGFEEFRRAVEKYIVDDAHGVVLKAIPKTGCSSWKTILIQNQIGNGSDFMEINPHHWKDIATIYNLKLLSNMKQRFAINTLNKYYTILTVRHPLDRIESGYRDKFIRKFNLTTNIVDGFESFLHNIFDHKYERPMDVHFRPYSWHTQPCAIPIDFIAKTETAAIEMDYIINTKLSGIGQAILRNNVSVNFGNPEETIDGGRILTLFSALSDPQKYIETLMDKYGLDMKLFGYSYKIKDGKVIALCDHYDRHGMCC